ncbi:hypothetical protein HYT57_05820 [Candidatus Woesearchaeota archaeon]|nr:hypothetical protein [Candidatus Woesearchaeota archaeon]
MEKKEIIQAIQNLREFSKKRNFKQSVDLIINLKGLDVKKQGNSIDIFAVLPNARKKKIRVCALVGQELAQSAKIFDKVVSQDEFSKYQANPKLVTELTRDYDLFVAQANLMGPIATTFGRTLGPKGMMPNPRSGAVVPPEANLEVLFQKLQKTVRLQTKKEPSVKAPVGSEDMTDEELAENVLSAYNNLVHVLPQEAHNIKNVELKTTMGPAIKIGESKEHIQERLKPKEKPMKTKKK